MKIAFDIGANIGQTTEKLLNYYDKIICYEPNYEIFQILETKFGNNNKVILENLGLSDTEGEKIFHISNSHVLSTFSQDWIDNSRFTNLCNWEKKVKVRTTTLDKIILQYGVPSFIKIDVEGYEYEVFKGLTNLHENVFFAFEWAEEQYNKINETILYLQNLGYKNFSFTYQDNIVELEKINWDSWENLSLHNDINTSRKEKWGMIYLKK